LKRRIFCLVLCLALALGATAQAADTASVAVAVDGVTQERLTAGAYEGTSYVSLYGVTLALRPDAVITWEDGQLVARAEDFTLSARIGASYLVANGRYLYIPGGVKMDDTGDTLVPARTLALALGAAIAWTGAVEFTSGGTPILSGDQFYNAGDLDLLARVITHESGNQPLAGKIAVGNVIINRTRTSGFPDTISDVIYERNQFPGAANATPNAESVIAAKLCLDGAVTVPGALYFNGVGKSCWASRNKTHLATIGGHAFYG
jgi:N-acetylmuramoyl-L-alanine amidase